MEKEIYIKITNEVRELIEKSATQSPPDLSETLVKLTSLSANLSEALDDILVFKPDELIRLRVISKTNAEAEWAWKSSKEGKQEVYLRGWLQRIKDQKSAIKSRLQIHHDSAYGQF